MTDETNIPIISVGGASPGPRMLIIAGVHGDEFEPMAAVRRLAGQLDAKRVHGSITLAPCVNDSAFRKNARVGEDGLDLARVCPGDPAGSVTMRAAARVSELIRSHDYLIDLHTGGTTLALHPLAGYVLHTSTPVLDTQRQMAIAMGLSLIWGTSAKLEGRTLSVARDASVPAIYAEFGGSGAFDDTAVDAYANGCVHVLRQLRMIEPFAPLSLAPAAGQTLIEDNRDRAGHLQIQHPSPADGFFEPACKLGDWVTVGQSIGRVIDHRGELLATILAAEHGMVVMLRTWRHVGKGDALAALAAPAAEASS